jgi:hypothetical protein
MVGAQQQSKNRTIRSNMKMRFFWSLRSPNDYGAATSSKKCFPVRLSVVNGGKALRAGDKITFQPASDFAQAQSIAAEVRVIG